MATTRLFMCCALLMLPALSRTAWAAAPPPAEAFGAIPQTDDVTLSPDGKVIAWQSRNGGETGVMVYDLESRKNKHGVRIEKTSKLRSLTWADNETLIVELSITDPNARAEDRRHEFFRFLSLDINTGTTRFLLMSGNRTYVTGAHLLSVRASKPKTVIMSTLDYSASNEREQIGSRIENRRKDSGWALSVFEVNTVTGAATLIEGGNPFTRYYLVDRTGAVVARSDFKPDDRVCSILAKQGAGWKEIYHAQDGTELYLEGLNAAGTAILALSNQPKDSHHLLSLPLDGSPMQVAFEDPTREINYVLHDRFTAAPVAILLGGANPVYHWLDPADQGRLASVQRAFPGKDVITGSESEDRQRVVAYVYGPSLPGVYYLVDFKAHSADIVGEEYPALNNAALGTVTSISYAARDGTQIPAYLTVPPGAKPQQLPLVVLPHGGPESRDWPRFDWWAQFLATRGYAVLQPQFRGSKGFGDAYRLAGRRQWGGLMQDDLSDGVRAMIAQGVADPARVCIVGASYGGYAALAGAAFTPELYACAVSINGVSNLPAMLGWEADTHGTESDEVSYWKESIGPKLDPEVIAKSPLKAVDAVRAPVLLIYSVDDTVVPPSQSREMAEALKSHGTPTTLLKLDGDDHWLSHTESRVQMLRAIDDFLAVNLRK